VAAWLAGWRVDQVQHAGGEGGGRDQPERHLGTVGEQLLAVPDHYGVHEQVQLVDQALLEQPADQGRAAGGAEVVVLLELGQLGLDVAADEGGVLPGGVGERGRGDSS